MKQIQTENDATNPENNPGKENIPVFWVYFTLAFLIFLIAVQSASRWMSLGLKSDVETILNQEYAELNNTNSEQLRRILPKEEVKLPVYWMDTGKRMVDAGVIDKDKLESLYVRRGGLNETEKNLLYGEKNQELVINEINAGFLLNLLWAFGLSNKNPILEEGAMTDVRYGGDPSRFASTGGWTLSIGDVMNHYSGHAFFELTSAEQSLVERVSENIYRPCCGNSTFFPDCNHGMAMLGLLELMAAQGVSEEEMYETALLVNSFWFPDTYLAIAKYFENQGVSWSEVDPKEVLGESYSSAEGYAQVLSEIGPIDFSRGGSCGV